MAAGLKVDFDALHQVLSLDESIAAVTMLTDEGLALGDNSDALALW